MSNPAYSLTTAWGIDTSLHWNQTLQQAETWDKSILIDTAKFGGHLLPADLYNSFPVVTQ